MMTTCWECGAGTDRPQAASVRWASGATRTFQLCPTCYQDHYLPLIANRSSGVDRGGTGTTSAEWPAAARMGLRG